MKPINTSIYSKKQNQTSPTKTSNVRKSDRKVRNDKKLDIQIPLSLEQRQIIKILARKNRTTPTSYCAALLKKGLIRNHEFPTVQYPDSKEKTVHAKLESDYYDMLFNFSVKWDYSIRKAAHRILVEMIKLEDSEVWEYGKGF